MSEQWNETKAASLLGKHVLVGVTWMEADGTIIDRRQMHGVVLEVDRRQGVTLRLAESDETFTLPPTLEAFTPAAPGEYRLKSTGEVVKNPDYLSTWNIHRPPIH